jgi:hypothetical protein
MANKAYYRLASDGTLVLVELVDNGDGTYSESAGAGGGVGAGTVTDRSGTITTGGTAKAAMAANASRKSVFVLNPDTETEDLGVSEVGTATLASPSIVLHPGDAWQPAFVPLTAISVIAATTGHVYIAREGT